MNAKALFYSLLFVVAAAGRGQEVSCFIFDPDDWGSLIEYSRLVSTDTPCPTDVIVPNFVTSIRDRIFGCRDLTSIALPEGLVSIGQGAFRDNDITSLVIPDSVTSIGTGAFAFNALTSLVISKNLTSIELNTFGNNDLTSVFIPKSVLRIEARAFYGNRRLKDVCIEAHRESIEIDPRAFQMTEAFLTFG